MGCEPFGFLLFVDFGYLCYYSIAGGQPPDFQGSTHMQSHPRFRTACCPSFGRWRFTSRSLEIFWSKIHKKKSVLIFELVTTFFVAFEVTLLNIFGMFSNLKAEEFFDIAIQYWIFGNHLPFVGIKFWFSDLIDL